MSEENVRPELKACDFCGNKPKHHEGDDYVLSHTADCFFSQHYAQEMWLVGKRKVKSWNTRAADQERDLRGAVLDYLKHPSLDGSPIRQQKRDKLQTLAKTEKQQESK